MNQPKLSDLTRTAIKAAYRIAGLDKEQPFAAWLSNALDRPAQAGLDMYQLLHDVVHSKYGPFWALPQLEQHAIEIALDIVDFSVTLFLENTDGEHFITWDIEVSEGLLDGIDWRRPADPDSGREAADA